MKVGHEMEIYCYFISKHVFWMKPTLALTVLVQESCRVLVIDGIAVVINGS